RGGGGPDEAARWCCRQADWAADFAWIQSCSRDCWELDCRERSTLLCDIIGNPFRPIVFDNAWRTPTVAALATAAYEERELPDGTLDADRLAVLADALEDAGCDNADILSHLRGPGPHVRGCCVVDLLLGKERLPASWGALGLPASCPEGRITALFFRAERTTLRVRHTGLLVKTTPSRPPSEEAVNVPHQGGGCSPG